MTEYPTRWFDDTGENEEFDRGVSKRIYRDRETGNETTNLPIGALFFPSTRSYGAGSLICVIPCASNADGKTWWHIDGRATNCTRPDDSEHRCWVRHGEDGGEIHVDKNGNTCAAGAGSIMVDGFHGFLHRGILKDC